MIQGLGFKAQGLGALGFTVQGLGFWAQGSSRVQGLRPMRFGVEGLRVRRHGCGRAEVGGGRARQKHTLDLQKGVYSAP